MFVRRGIHRITIHHRVDLDAAIQSQVFEGIFEFLDDDGDGHVNLRELMALSVIGDADGK